MIAVTISYHRAVTKGWGWGFTTILSPSYFETKLSLIEKGEKYIILSPSYIFTFPIYLKNQRQP